MRRDLIQYYGVFVMAFISLSNVFFSYDADNNLLDGVSVVFDSSEKVAIVGDNGTGKSTLLRMLNGDVVPDSGQCIRNADVYMLEQINVVDSKSGGEAQLDALARAFDSGADILLLDEPTNNLDSDAKSKFFDNLLSYPFGAVIVSHDRELLQFVNKIIEVSDGNVRVFGGNYDFWIAQKRTEQECLHSKYVDAGKEVARLIGTMQVAQIRVSIMMQKLRTTLQLPANTGKYQERRAMTLLSFLLLMR